VRTEADISEITLSFQDEVEHKERSAEIICKLGRVRKYIFLWSRQKENDAGDTYFIPSAN
jgi:hypothetical protein